MPFISNIDDLIKTFSEYIDIVKFLKGDDSKNVSSVNQDGEVTIHAPNNSGSIDVHVNTYHFYRDKAGN